MTNEEKMVMKAKIAMVFTPSAPIDNKALFAGRKPQLTKLINAALQRGQHAILFGERGVGKTSLGNVLHDFLTPVSEFLIASTNCDAGSDFKTIWNNILNQLTVTESETGMGYEPPVRSEEIPLSRYLSDKPSPEEIRQQLEKLAQPAIIIIDELDRIKDRETTAHLADTVKTFSDHSTDVTLILIGVADSLDSLIAEHESIERALIQIQMPRMSPSELMEIIDNGLKQLKMSIELEAKRRISNLSHGLPHYTHLLALYAAQAAVDRDSLEINQADIVTALNEAIENAQQSIRKSYIEATSSPRGNLYTEVLLSCALAETDEMGYFPAVNVRAPMSKIMGKPYDVPAFSRHLNDFCEKDRSAILQRTGFPKRYRFRFGNPLMEPYVVMKGIVSGRIGPEILESGEPVIHASDETPSLFDQSEPGGLK